MSGPYHQTAKVLPIEFDPCERPPVLVSSRAINYANCGRPAHKPDGDGLCRISPLLLQLALRVAANIGSIEIDDADPFSPNVDRVAVYHP